MKRKKSKKGKAGKEKKVTQAVKAVTVEAGKEVVKSAPSWLKTSWSALIDMVCPKCKREVQAEVGQANMGRDLLCKECFAVALKKVPRLKPKLLGDTVFVEMLRTAKTK